MNTYLLNLISKWTGIVVLSTISLFNTNIKTKNVIIENDIANKNEYLNAEIVEYDTQYIYDETLPSGHEDVIVEGNDGVIYKNGEEEIILEEKIDQVIEVGSGKEGIYTGMLTGYGPDCYGCSGTGNLYCSTKDNKTHSLVTDGIYYNDDSYGNVRILSADQREFPCGTIIEISNDKYDKELGIVLDTGSGMRNAFDNGWILIDLAFEKEEFAHTITNKNTTFVVKRWGW